MLLIELTPSFGNSRKPWTGGADHDCAAVRAPRSVTKTKNWVEFRLPAQQAPQTRSPPKRFMLDSPAIDVQQVRKSYHDGWLNRRSIEAL
ncbi:MAG: hypothetical protein KDA72_23400, partial [Planctomycetales bacterium]|nr:hypothetical protein [Planctomycetales bacterium]